MTSRLLKNHKDYVKSINLKSCNRAQLLEHLTEAQDQVKFLVNYLPGLRNTFANLKEMYRTNTVDGWYEFEANKDRRQYPYSLAWYQYYLARVKYIQRRLEYVLY